MAPKDPSLFEYTLKDSSVRAVTSSNASFPFSSRGVSGHTMNPNGESSTGKGSGANPQFHTGIEYEPEFSLTLTIDEADAFDVWLRDFAKSDGGAVNIERKRSKPRVATKTDLLVGWLPIRGEEAFSSGEATMVEYTGKFLEIRRNIAA